MDRDNFAKLLPEAPRPGMAEWIKEKYWDSELGGDLCVFYRDSVFAEDRPLNRTMEDKDWDSYYKVNRNHWGASCTCTACGEHFVTGWDSNSPKNRHGIIMYCGDDGINYDGYIDPKNIDIGCDAMEYRENDKIVCPYCCTTISLVHKKRLTKGRTYQILVTSMEVVEGHAVLVIWIASRQIDEAGRDEFNITPREALAIEGKKFYRFQHTKFRPLNAVDDFLPTWRPSNYSGEDLTLHRYYNVASLSHKKADAVTWQDVPDLTGTSGEKTGIYEYIKGFDFPLPFAYLKLWAKHPSAENIIKSPWNSVLDTALWREAREKNYSYSSRYGISISEIDFNECAPHKMLGISKGEAKVNYGWDCDQFSAYKHHQMYVNKLTVAEYDELLAAYSYDELMSLDLLSVNYDISYRRMLNYLDKNYTEYIVQTYVDYIEMLGEGEHTDVELFPRNLRQAHDRLAELIEIQKHERLIAEFAELAEKYKALTWTDGELCIRIAAKESELVAEGRTLKHCVGSYGKRHTSGSDCIFFVRRYRRPERSYYTLDINMTTAVPKEVQLHGYGNEFANGKRLAIPQKVREFVDRWEKEILVPTVAKMKAEELEKKEDVA